MEINGNMQQFSKSGHEVSWSPSNAKIGEILGVYDVFDNNPDIGVVPAKRGAAQDHVSRDEERLPDQPGCHRGSLVYPL